MKCMIQFLQVHQGAGLGAAIHNVLILDAQQVALGNHDIDVTHQAGDTIQVQTVLQLHLCEGIATGMRTDPHRLVLPTSTLQRPLNFAILKSPIYIAFSFNFINIAKLQIHIYDHCKEASTLHHLSRFIPIFSPRCFPWLICSSGFRAS